MASLRGEFGESSNTIYEINGNTTTIGRHGNCDVVIDSPAVSRFHAKIIREDNRYYLEDLGSRNGLVVNGHQVRRRTPLNDGDRIEVSTLPFVFSTENSLSQPCGSWGVRPSVISISQSSSELDDSVRRQVVQSGDQIPNEAFSSSTVREDQILGRIPVADGSAGWPVVNHPEQKLNQILRLLYSLKRMIRREDVLSTTLQMMFELFPSAERLAVVLTNEKNTGVHVAAAAARHIAEEVQICLPVIRDVMRKSEAILYAGHWRLDTSANTDLQNLTLRYVISAPFVGVIDGCFGAIQIDTGDTSQPFDKPDLERLVVFAQAIAFALENVTEFQSEIRRSVIESRTDDADRLRRELIPESGPRIPGYRLTHHILNSPDVAADFIDYVAVSGGRVAVIVVDVPGRGMEATSLMTGLAMVLAQSVSEVGSAAQALQMAAGKLRQRGREIPLLTSVGVMILNPADSTVSVAIAGHCPLFRICGDTVLALTEPHITGSAFGADELYPEMEFELAEDDAVVLFTDGISRMYLPDGVMLSPEQICETIRSAASGPHELLDASLVEQLDSHRGAAPISDDVLFSLIHRQSESVRIGVRTRADHQDTYGD